MTISASNLLLVNDQREYLFGIVGLAQTDINNLVKVAAGSRTDAQFNGIVKAGQADIASSYGDLLSGETKNFYNRLRTNNGGGFFDGRLPGFDDFYNNRKNASIDTNTSLKYATDYDNLIQRLVNDIVSQINEYSYETVNFLGNQDDDFTASRRVPRADACSFCRWKAYEFSVYGSKLDDVVLHKSCRCVSAPGFKFTDEDYLNDERQNLFTDRFDKIAREHNLAPNQKKDLKLLLTFLREDHGYK